MRMRAGTVLAAALGLAAGAAPAVAAESAAAAEARTVKVTSFDGTEIVTHFFPARNLADGERAPTVLVGPGWSAPGDRTGETRSSDSGGVVGTGVLRDNGYNVVTWDPRGFGGSGGEANVNHADKEGRDVSALIDWIAQQPEVRLDRAGDPRVGMAGGSYGGGAQFVTAAADHRLDALVPSIAWNSLISSLYPGGAYKAGWAGILCAGGMAGTNRVDAHVRSACVSGATTGAMSPEDAAWYGERGPGGLVRRIEAPTLILQGTVDTLFPLDEAVANYEHLLRAGTPVKMAWFCGGHGACASDPGPAGHIEKMSLNWFSRYLKGERTATGPAFEYVDDTGTWRGASGYPLPREGALRASGQGVLEIRPGDTSGTPTAARPAAKAVTARVKSPRTEGQVVGAPEVRLVYRGKATGGPATTFVYAQIVDERTGVVVGNQATPIPVRLDGRPRTVSLELETIAWRVARDSRLTLQITSGTALYTPQRATADLTLQATVTLPLARPGIRVTP
ncbi:CocE/NonD family hydrolase [Planomonospora corallina]|uniref:CocE/NonD family hydrolase n=1 Tax=Planomonospora corallina TaxID=1806052 RepID=A0ABV8I230_9ACTN